jgi:hypothetical protein
MKLRYLSVLLLLVVTSFFLIAPRPTVAQASAVLKWAQVDKPGRNGNIVVNPSEVSDIAVGRGNILYAIDSANSKLYRSDNAGLTWLDITSAILHAGASLPATKIACAPDQPKTVAVVTNGGTKVYFSSNFGAEWKDTGLPSLPPMMQIQCIAISGTYILGGTNLWDVAIGTAIWGNNNTEGQVWVLTTGGSLSTWQNTNVTVDPSHIGAELSAIAFSPNYTDEGTILAVASTAADVAAIYRNQTWLCAGQRDLSAQTTSWNSSSPYFTNYPVQIDSTGDAPGVTGIVSSIALPSDYRGTDISSRKVLMSCDRQPAPMIANSDVYRIDDYASTRVLRLNASGGAPIDIRNVAYYGTLNSGKVIAGDVNPEPGLLTTQVRRLNDPFGVTTPSAWMLASQPPTGPGNAAVAWSYDGSVAFCGTGRTPGANNDESAFSRSADNGDTWEQTSLINTIVNICDIAPAPDSKSFFLASYSGFGPESVWRTAGEPLGSFWGRVLTMYTSSDRLILRLSPDYGTDYTIYVAEVNGSGTSSLMAVSHNRGNTWQKPYGPAPIIDMAVEDPHTFYVALPGGYIRKNTTDGAAWLSPPVSCFPDSTSEINMLTVVGNGDILAGSRDSRVSYSTDNGTSFTEIDKPVGYHTGDVQVVADANYDKNKLIYAADNIIDDGIWRWTISTSTEWEQIDEAVTILGTNQQICGLGMGKEGTLYALRSDNVTGSGGGGMDRSLNPSHSYVWQIEFDVLSRTLPVLPSIPLAKPTSFDPRIIFPNTMPSLKLASDVNQNVVWAVDFDNMLIYRFDDNICKVGPVINGPKQIGCDPVSGRNQEVNINWEQLSLSDQYELQIAKDDQFSIQVAGNDHVIPVDLMAPAVFFPAGGMALNSVSEIANWGNLECGHTYYWRTRTRQTTTGEIIRSPWSEIGSFTVKAGLPVTADYYSPKLLSPDNGCVGCPVKPASFSWAPYKETTKYEFVLAKDATMTQVVADDEADTSAYEYDGTLDYSSNYFWRVMALEPAPSDWSTTFVFQTEVTPAPPAPPVAPAPTALGVWVIIAIGAILVIVTLVLIFKTRRV